MAYDHDGLVTKRHLRVAAIAYLRPQPGQCCWDVGAGAGSVGIEWCRAAEGASCLAVERNPERLARAATNASRLGVSDRFHVEEGDALERIRLWRALGAVPDAVFVGGGATSEVIDECWEALAVGGRLVAHAVTVETEALLFACHARYGGELHRVSVEHLDMIGTRRGWRPARSVVTWATVKPC